MVYNFDWLILTHSSRGLEINIKDIKSILVKMYIKSIQQHRYKKYFFTLYLQIFLHQGDSGFGMGGSDSTVEHHYHTIQYRTDPQTVKMMESCTAQIVALTQMVANLQKSYEEAMIKAKQLQSPEKYEQFKEEAFTAFLNNIHKLKFTEPIPRVDGHKHHILIGNISSGKTSLINFACGTDLPVGLGECTQECAQVAVSASGKVHIWDCPGINEHFSIFNPEALSYFHTADKIFILYPDSVKNCRQICLVLSKIKPNDTYAVRTHCDKWETNHKKTIEQEIETDKKLLEKWGLKTPVLATSAKKPASFKDNQLFITLLKNP